MDDKSYSKPVIGRFIRKNLFFDDPVLKRYYEDGEVKKFRNRVHKKYSDKQFSKVVYAIVTDSIRDVILDAIGELTILMKSMGDLIISGGEAFNMYMSYNDRIITTDIDAKFVPKFQRNSQYFGKLQATKLIMWNALGKMAKRLNNKIKQRIVSKREKMSQFLGVGFKKKGPYVTRRYTLIKKKKGSESNVPKKEDIFIDVELFALDLKVRYFCPCSGKIKDFIVGGILDIPFMRPKEFGYEVIKNANSSRITYRNMDTGNMKINGNVKVASKEFLIKDIYLMQKLNLRPDKKDKDRQRLFRLAKLFTNKVKSTDNIDVIFKKVQPVISTKPTRKSITSGKVRMNNAVKINPRMYEEFTTVPSKKRLSKQIVHGLKIADPQMKVKEFEKTNGDYRLNIDTYLWKKNNSNDYIKNEFNMRPTGPMKIPSDINIQETLYGFKPRRDGWVPKPLLKRAAEIPFVGLKI